jgi:hypothetical protein
VTTVDCGAGEHRRARLDRYATVATALAPLSDRRLAELVAQAPVLGSGIGGTSQLLQVEGVPAFVKRAPLTAIERRPDNIMSTANLFGLPVSCQYGVGSPGFGVWRELAANTMTTSWVLAGRSESFPLMYHWRVLDIPAFGAGLVDELADIDGLVEYWHGSLAVRRRTEAMVASSASVTLFLEYLPWALPEWLTAQFTMGNGAADAALAMVERSLRRDIAFMNEAGLFHFDAHFGNIMTDGRHLYFGDLGLATSPLFELSPEESAFLALNQSHDPCHTISWLVHWLVTNLTAADLDERDALVLRCSQGLDIVDMLPSASAVIKRYAPIAVVLNRFYRRLQEEDRTTEYPGAEVAQACVSCGFEMPWARRPGPGPGHQPQAD